MKADSILATIGNTPHVRLSRLFPDHEVWVKSERTNPGAQPEGRRHAGLCARWPHLVAGLRRDAGAHAGILTSVARP